jgi:hypothetical protein
MRMHAHTARTLQIHEGSGAGGAAADPPGAGGSSTLEYGEYFTEFLSGRIRRHPIFAGVSFWQHILAQTAQAHK